MADERYSRWQSIATGQLSVAVALVSALAVAGLGGGLSLLQDGAFKLLGGFRYAFIGSMLLLMLCALASCGAVVATLPAAALRMPTPADRPAARALSA